MVISKNKRFALFVVLFFIFSFNSYSDNITLTEIYKKVIAKYNEIKTYEAKINQENYWSELDVEKTSTGNIYYDGERFLLKYTEPSGQKLFIEKEVLNIIDESNKQVFISDLEDFELRPDKILTYYWKISDKEIITSDEYTKLKLFGETDTLYVSISNDLIVEILIIDSNNNSVKYKFYDVKINSSLPVNIFELFYPDEFNVIDNRLNN